MTTNSSDLNLLANVFGPVSDEASRQLANIRTWIEHPSHSSKADIRRSHIELQGMWKLAYRITGYPSFEDSADAYNASKAIRQISNIIEVLNDLQYAKNNNPSLLSTLGI